MVGSGNDGFLRSVNVEDPHATEAIFRLNGLKINGPKNMVKIAAFNSMGTGPFSDPGVAIVYDQYAGRDLFISVVRVVEFLSDVKNSF